MTVTMGSDKQVTASFKKTGKGLPLIWIGIAVIVALIAGVLILKKQ